MKKNIKGILTLSVTYAIFQLVSFTAAYASNSAAIRKYASKKSGVNTAIKSRSIKTGISINKNNAKKNSSTKFPINSSNNNSSNSRDSLHKNLYNYMMVDSNRKSIMNQAVKLHKGDSKNTCVYFASEALRRVGVSLPDSLCNTVNFTNTLTKLGWKKSTDLSNLLPGDICFTTSTKTGPTHAYIFMSWTSSANHNYAYICDNQAKEYKNNIYHIRNVDIVLPGKEAISYFMYKQ